MKLPVRQKNKKIFFALGIGLLMLVVLAGGWYFFGRHAQTPPQTGSINYNPPTQEEKKETAEQKDQLIKDQETPPANPDIIVTVTSVFQDPNGVHVRALVSGTNSGQCEIILSQNGSAQIVKTFPVVFEATSASCQNATFPLSEIPAAGIWNVSIIVKKDATQSAAVTTTVNVVK